MSERDTTFSPKRVRIPYIIMLVDHSQYGTEVTCAVSEQLVTLLQVAADFSSASFSLAAFEMLRPELKGTR